MPARKLLLATYHFPPSAGVAVHRLLGFVNQLRRFDWETVVVAPPQVPHEPQEPELVKDIPPTTTVVPVPFPDGLMSRCLGRVLPRDILWLPRARRACALAVATHRPDALLTSGPPHCVHWLGLKMHKQFGLPWLACFRDPWVTNGRPGDRPSRWARRMETRVMAQANGIIANTPLGLAGLRAAYPAAADRMVCITNGFDPDRFPLPPPRPERERLLLLHAGELYMGRDPRPLLDAMKDLEAEGKGPRFALHFLGRSTEGLCNLAEEARRRGLDKVVTVADQVPYPQALAQMVDADLLLLIHTPGYRIGVPAKLYEYFGAAKPILALAETDSDIAQVLQSSGLPHRVAPPRDPARIKQALRELGTLATQPFDLAAAGPGLLAFTRAHLAEQLAQLLAKCIQKS